MGFLPGRRTCRVGQQVQKCINVIKKSILLNIVCQYIFPIYRVIAQLWPSISKFLTTEVCNLSISTTVLQYQVSI